MYIQIDAKMAYMIPRKRFFYISSGTQLSETVSTFSAELQIPDSEEYDRISLTQCLIPLSYYVISAGLNVFQLNENGVSVPITVPPGNYDAVNLPAVVVPLLNAASPNMLTYTMTFPNPATDPQTGKFTYTVSSNSDLVYFAFPPGQDIAIRFGFDRGETEYFTPDNPNDGKSTLISPNVVDFTAQNAIQIHSNLVADAYTDVLQEVYQANVAPVTNITFLNPDPLAYSKALSSSKIKAASFSITDEFGSPIFLNGLDVVLTIIIYKEPDFFERAEAYIKYKAHLLNAAGPALLGAAPS
jgi:hypothetical protein